MGTLRVTRAQPEMVCGWIKRKKEKRNGKAALTVAVLQWQHNHVSEANREERGYKRNGETLFSSSQGVLDIQICALIRSVLLEDISSYTFLCCRVLCRQQIGNKAVIYLSIPTPLYPESRARSDSCVCKEGCLFSLGCFNEALLYNAIRVPL